MKPTTLILMCAGLALAKKGAQKAQADSNNLADAANNNATDVAAPSNSTDVSGNNSTANATANNGNNGNNLVQDQNGTPCINVDALSNVK